MPSNSVAPLQVPQTPLVVNDEQGSQYLTPHCFASCLLTASISNLFAPTLWPTVYNECIGGFISLILLPSGFPILAPIRYVTLGRIHTSSGFNNSLTYSTVVKFNRLGTSLILVVKNCHKADFLPSAFLFFPTSIQIRYAYFGFFIIPSLSVSFNATNNSWGDILLKKGMEYYIFYFEIVPLENLKESLIPFLLKPDYAILRHKVIQ